METIHTRFLLHSFPLTPYILAVIIPPIPPLVVNFALVC